MRFYSISEPGQKVLIERNPRPDVMDHWAKFRYGVYETDDKKEIRVLSARPDIFNDKDPDFAGKLAQAQGNLRRSDIQAALERPGHFNCPFCPTSFNEDDLIINHMANEHGVMPRAGAKTPEPAAA